MEHRGPAFAAFTNALTGCSSAARNSWPSHRSIKAMDLTKRLWMMLLTASLVGPAFAHEPRPGPNGGMKVDAGAKHHAELVANGSPEVAVYLYDAADRPVPATGFRANAILVVNGATQRFPLEPRNGNRLVGTAAVPVPAGVKGAIQLTAPDGATAQARF